MKLIIASLLPLASLQSFASNETEDWVKNLQSDTEASFTVSTPDMVPPYVPGQPDNGQYGSNPHSMATNASIEATTNEGAKVIYDLGGRPNVADEKWYQDATDITKDPSSVIDTTNGEYTDCEEVTTPGDTITTERGCTDTRISETRSCSIGRDIDLDTNYLYECNVERSQVANECEVGRVIDVTQSHNYKCSIGKESFEQSCSDTLIVTVEHFITRKYHPVPYCEYTTSDPLNEYLKDGIYKPKGIILETSYNYGFVRNATRYPHFYEVKKLGGQCNIDVFVAPFSASKQEYTYHSTLITGTNKTRCKGDDVLASDGFCYSKEAIEFTSAIPHCTQGTFSNGKCFQEPAWGEYYSLDPNNAKYILINPNSTGWFDGGMVTYTNNGLAYFMPTNFTKPNIIYELEEISNRGPKIYYKLGNYKGKKYSGSTAYDSYSILVSNTKDPIITDPIYTCNGTQVDPSTRCETINPPTETTITEEWVKTCS